MATSTFYSDNAANTNNDNTNDIDNIDYTEDIEQSNLKESDLEEPDSEEFDLEDLTTAPIEDIDPEENIKFENDVEVDDDETGDSEEAATGEELCFLSELIEVKDILYTESTLRASHDTKELETSLAANGMLEPLLVRYNPKYNQEDDDGFSEKPFIIVFGRHRLRAATILSWELVPAIVREMTEFEAAIAEIDENLSRHDLSRIEKFKHLQLRQKLYNDEYDVNKIPQSGRLLQTEQSENNIDNTRTRIKRYDEITAATAGISESTMRRDIAIAKKLPDEVVSLLRDTPVGNNRSELERLSRIEDKNGQLAKDRQIAIAEKISTAEAKNIYEAQNLIEGKVRVAVEPGIETPGERFVKTLDLLQVKTNYLGRLLDDINTDWGIPERLHFYNQMADIKGKLEIYMELFDDSDSDSKNHEEL